MDNKQLLDAIEKASTNPADQNRKKNARAEPAFAAEGELPLSALQAQVAGFGVLAASLSPEQAQALHAISTPAPHGQRERTVLDTRVRHTGEIAAEKVQLQWATGALAGLLEQAAAALGLDHLEARFHGLLVYGPGQFFKPHQDTEKHPGMVASLVLVWPSAHLGGELQIWQADTLQRFASQHLQAKTLRWSAFYADCRHEVKPVSEGWRVVLTFDLVLPISQADTNETANPELVQALRELFDQDEAPRRTPWLLLLDHEYTEHGLRWPLLKGEDRARVDALRPAAAALGLVTQLALAEIRQSFTAVHAYESLGRGRARSKGPEPDELIDEEMRLDFWVDTDGCSHHGQSLGVTLKDCASFTPEHADFLVDEEYEGYMGNYGETLDYWYRRAALVLQSPAAAEASRFVTQPKAALTDALKLARQGGQRAALAQRLQLAMPDLQHYARAQGRTVLAEYAQLAAFLPAELASALCAPFEWQQLKPTDTLALADLAKAHGDDWLIGLLRSWAHAAVKRQGWGWSLRARLQLDEETVEATVANEDNAQEIGAAIWPRPLPAFIQAAQAAQSSASVLNELLTLSLHALQAVDAAKYTPAQRRTDWPVRRHWVCQLAQALQQLQTQPLLSQQAQSLLKHLQSRPELYPPRDLVPLLKVLDSPLVRALSEHQTLVAATRTALQSALHQAVPAPDDHGLREISWTCHCADCRPAIVWAESASKQPLLLAMAEARRSHVQQALQDAAAPLNFDTLRKGSPHKLVLTKSPHLHAQWQQQREAWAADLAAL